ncbi:good for full DBP5 activity protein 2 [Naviculisporaceae sp. PSN 640]
MSDYDSDEFLERLRQLTGQTEVWEGFSTEDTEDPQDEVDTEEKDYDSDVSQDLILNTRHLTMATNKPNQGRNYKMNKARAFAADSPETPRTVENLMKIKWNETGLERGEMSHPGQSFVPWKLVKGYPYMYVGKRNSERTAPFFSLAALHEGGRVWDLFYTHYPPGTDKRPLIFVPTYQFQHLLDVINAKLDIKLTIPPGKNELRFNMIFGAGDTPRPRFLGRSSDTEAWTSMTRAIPEPLQDDTWEKATQAGKDEYMNLLYLATSGKSKEKNSERNREKRINNHKAWGQSLKRAQRYLGLREQYRGAATGPATLDLACPPACAPEDSVLFVSIDVEAYEFNQAQVSEVGISTLDATTLAGVAPGAGLPLGSEGWYPSIHARHLRIKENLWVHNKTHVKGCPLNFLFGESEVVSQDDVVPLIQALIQRTVDGKKRNIVLVFHDAAADIKFLQGEGYDILGEENVIDVLDTKEMDQYVTRSHNPHSLESVLRSLNMSYQYLHNAGNDAMYTMRAMVSLALKGRQISVARSKKEKKAATTPASEHVPYAEFKKQEEEDEGWSSGGEDSDGGLAPHRYLKQTRPSW